MPDATTTYLDLIEACDNYPYTENHHKDFYKLKLPRDDGTHGYMLPEIVAKIPWTSDFTIDHKALSVTVLDSSNGADTSAACTAAFQTLIDTLIDGNIFQSVGQHSEPYSILGAPYPVHLERFASSLFGTIGRGAHLTAYTQTPSGMKIWVPRRSAHLKTYPDMLDTTVAGGVPAGTTPFEQIVLEADEEASLDAELVRRHVRSVGAMTYMSVWDRGGVGLVVPDVIYLYDLELAAEVVPKPRDEEVKEFYLLTVDEVKKAMFNREFKPNCAAVMIDFFIRHGIVTDENEKDFVEILTRLHRKLPFRMAPKDN